MVWTQNKPIQMWICDTTQENESCPCNPADLLGIRWSGEILTNGSSDQNQSARLLIMANNHPSLPHVWVLPLKWGKLYRLRHDTTEHLNVFVGDVHLFLAKVWSYYWFVITLYSTYCVLTGFFINRFCVSFRIFICYQAVLCAST